jgi:hypothetical protein
VNVKELVSQKVLLGYLFCTIIIITTKLGNAMIIRGYYNIISVLIHLRWPFYLYSLLSGIFFTVVYLLTKTKLPGKGIVKKGLVYGLIMFLGGLFLIGLLFVLNPDTDVDILRLSIENLLICFSNGLIVAKLCD